MLDHLVGRILNQRYEIRALKGSGGMGVVFEAYDVKLQRSVAIKMIKPHSSLMAKWIDAFHREAQTVARLDHPNIIRVFDLEDYDDSYTREVIPYLVMQFAGGGTLADQLTSGLPSYIDTSRVLSEVSQALDYAHNKGVVHFDIKPQNILFGESGQLLISDFGIAKLLQGATHVKADTYRGTPGYMSPEQVLGANAGRSSDVYALGITLHELIVGVRPTTEWNGKTLSVNVSAAIPGSIADIIRHATNPDPSKRYSTAGDFAKKIRDILQPRSLRQPKRDIEDLQLEAGYEEIINRRGPLIRPYSPATSISVSTKSPNRLSVQLDHVQARWSRAMQAIYDKNRHVHAQLGGVLPIKVSGHNITLFASKGKWQKSILTSQRHMIEQIMSSELGEAITITVLDLVDIWPQFLDQMRDRSRLVWAQLEGVVLEQCKENVVFLRASKGKWQKSKLEQHKARHLIEITLSEIIKQPVSVQFEVLAEPIGDGLPF